MLILDQDNARACMGWVPGRQFRDAVCCWASAQSPSLLVIIEIDEGKHKGSTEERKAPRARSLVGDRVLAVYSGSRWRADDGVVRDTEWWLSRPSTANLLVVTSDKLVRRRCNEAKQRATPQARVRFESSEAFSMLLRDPAPDPAPPPDHMAASGVDAAPMSTSQLSPGAPVSGTDAQLSAAGVNSPMCEFLAWINEECPGPQRTASQVVHGGAPRVQRGTKRRRR